MAETTDMAAGTTDMAAGTTDMAAETTDTVDATTDTVVIEVSKWGACLSCALGMVYMFGDGYDDDYD